MKPKHNTISVFLRCIPIQKRIYLILVVLVAVAASATGLCYFSARDAMTRNASSAILHTLEQTAKNVDSELMRIKLSITSTTSSTATMQILQEYESMDYKSQVAANINLIKQMNSLSLINRGFAGGEIWNRDRLLCYTMNRITTGDARTSALARRVFEEEAAFMFLGSQKLEASIPGATTLNYMIIGVKIYSLAYGKITGCALFAFSEAQLFDAMFSKPTKDSYFCVTDSAGTILSNADKSLIGTTQDIKITRAVESAIASGTSFSLEILGEDIVAHYASSLSDWRILSVTNRRALLRAIDEVFKDFYIVLFLCCLALILIVPPVAKSIVDPICLLNRAMEDIRADNNPTLPETGCDEITSLTRTYNAMSSRIESLIEETRRMDEEKRVIQFQALQSQINPHFLYNTLDAVNWMAYLSDNTEICDLIGYLSQFFRLSLNKGNDFYTVREELSHVRSYIAIQRAHHRSNITVIERVAPETEKLFTLKVLLQPLVENAIEHGFEHGGSDGTIWISVYLQSNRLVYEVEDDGLGLHMTDKRPEDMPSSNGYGIRNINERIQLYFGHEYALTLRARTPRGTVARIQIPIIKENSDDICAL